MVRGNRVYHPLPRALALRTPRALIRYRFVHCACVRLPLRLSELGRRFQTLDVQVNGER